MNQKISMQYSVSKLKSGDGNMKVYVCYMDDDNSCSDPECCGGPFPYPSVKIFSSVKAALDAGVKNEEDLTEVELDNNEFVGIE